MGTVSNFIGSEFHVTLRERRNVGACSGFAKMRPRVTTLLYKRVFSVGQ